MTYITYAAEAGEYYLKAEGHAGYNPGNDIVCAAISVLLQTLWAGLSIECAGRGRKEERDGFFSFRISVGAEKRREAQALFGCIIQGLELIERGYPAQLAIRGGAGAF